MTRKLFVLLVCMLLLPVPLWAILPDHGGSLPNIDKRVGSPSPGKDLASAQGRAEAALTAQVPEVEVRTDVHFGNPSWVHARSGFLTGPGGEGRAVSAAAAISARDPRRPVKLFLHQYRDLYGYGPEILDSSRIKREYVTAPSGMKTVIWEQMIQGIPVFEGLLVGHTTGRGELISVSSHFVPRPSAALAASGLFDTNSVAAPAVSAEQAVILAAKNVGAGDQAAVERKESRDQANPIRRFRSAALKGEIRTHLSWFPLKRDAVRLCWQVELTERAHGRLYRVLVDASNGEILLRHCLTYNLSAATYRVYTGDSPSPFSPGFSTPSTSQPATVPRELVTFSALDEDASPAGWINDFDNETKGNNVDAHLDSDDDDEPDLPRPQGSPDRVFDFPMDLAQAPSTYTDAAVVQLFYWNNWMHDQLYGLGFTEAAGNYQEDNFDRGGIGQDAVQADAQDGGGYNNANFSAPDDGTPGRMQMYVFTGPNPDRDGDFDAEVLLHEYTHGLSGRLVGGGVGIAELQTSGMGEGWSDFYAISLLSQPGDDLDGTYAAGAYVSYQLEHLEQNYYFGIRRYPYSTDLQKNPLTFKDIDPQRADSHDGIPLNPVFGGGPPDEVHNQGEVWCVTLWDARASLIRKHGFATGNRLILQLVTDGMKLSPANPTFLEARDAIILADQVLNGGANRDELWQAFAKRGMGFDAVAPPTSTTSGVVESFDVPDDLLIRPRESLSASGPEGGPFEPEQWDLTFSNVGTNTVRWFASATPVWFEISSASGVIAPETPPQTVRIRLGAIARSLPAGLYQQTVSITNITTGRVQSRSVSLRIGSRDYLTSTFSSADHPFQGRTFTFTPDGSVDHYSVCAEAATVFPTDPASGEILPIGDDDVASFDFPQKRPFPFFGTNYTHYFLTGNGYLTFLRGVSEFFPSLETHFGQPRVSGLFNDLDPSAGGVVTLSELPDHIAISFENVPEFLLGGQSSFQMELFFDGRIRLTYLDVGVTDGLVGLSAGEGLPDDFANSDFGRYGPCLPSLAVGLPFSVDEGEAGAVGRVSIPIPASASMVLNLTSYNAEEISIPGSVTVVAGQTEVEFPLTVANDTILNGTRIARIVASADGFRSGGARVEIHDDESATLRVLAPGRAREGDGLLRNLGSVVLGAAAAVPVVIRLSTSDPTELVVPRFTIIPAGATRATFDLTIQEDAEIDGTVPVEVRAEVANWDSGVATIQIEDNETTVLTLRLPKQLGEGTGLHVGRGEVISSGTLRTNLPVQITSSAPSKLAVPASVIIPAGDLSAKFDLDIADNNDIAGPQTVIVTAQASRFTNGVATVLILDDETPPFASGPSPAHLSTNNSPNTDLGWSPVAGELLKNGGFESGDFQSWSQEKSEGRGWAINDGTLDPEGPEVPMLPSSGRFETVTRQSVGGESLLFQEISIPAGVRSAKLTWHDRIRNQTSLFIDGMQQFAVEIRSPNNDLLATPFSTGIEDPPLSDWTHRSYDLGDFIGQTVRVVFRDVETFGYLNVHLDDVSLILEAKPPTYDIYFGTHPNLGPADLIGTATTNRWELPRLETDTTYYWQVAVRYATESRSPVWQFSTPPVGPLDHFAWEPVATPQSINQPIPATVRAEDLFGNLVTNFSGTASVAARVEFPLTNIGDGTDAWEYPLGGFLPLSRLQVIYTPEELGAARRLTALSLNLISLPDAQVNQWTIRIQESSLRSYSSNPLWERSGWTTVYQNNERFEETGWVTFPFSTPFDYDGVSSLLIDFSFKKSGFLFFDGDVASTTVSRDRSIFAQSFDLSDTPLTWSDTTPQPEAGQRIPNVRFESYLPVDATPAATGPFEGGIWSGFVVITELLDEVVLKVQDEDDHEGVSNPVRLGALDDVALTLTAAPSPVTVNQPVTYTLSVTNSGPSAATGVRLVDTLPVNAALVSAVSSQGSHSAESGALIFDLGRIEAHKVAVVTVIVQSGSVSATLVNSALLSRVEADGYAPNNAAEVVVKVNPVPTVTIADTSITEGDSGPTNAVVLVTLSVPSSLEITVDYQTADASAIAPGDYEAHTGRLRFLPGVTSQTISIPVAGDLVDEIDEFFTVGLTAADNAILRFGSEARVTIFDDDGPAISISDVALEEGDSGTSKALFDVSLSKPSVQRVTVDFTTIPGSATERVDFTSVSGTLTFPPGVTTQRVSVPILGDIEKEPTERFFVQLSDPDHATLSRGKGTGSIVNDDGIPGHLDHFAWGGILPYQSAGEPFAVGLAAADVNGSTVTNYTGSLTLSAAVVLPDATVGSGDIPWDVPIGTLYEDCRLQSIYLADELGGSGRFSALALNIETPSNIPLTRWTIRMKHTTLAQYDDASTWDRTGWTLVYQKTENITKAGWVSFIFRTPFDYNGTDHLLIDFSFNGSEYDFSFAQCFTTETEEIRSIYYQTDSEYGDPLNWSSQNPFPDMATQVPNIRLSSAKPVTLSPASAKLVGGTWSGLLTVAEPVENVTLTAKDTLGHPGAASPFSVVAFQDTDGDGLPDAYERSQGMNPSVAGDALGDADHDGLNNRQEYLAGTDPLDLRSVLTVEVLAGLAGDVVFRVASRSGKSYQLQASENVDGSDWRSIGSAVPGTGNVMEFHDTTSGAAYRLYRMVLSP